MSARIVSMSTMRIRPPYTVGTGQCRQLNVQPWLAST